MMKIRVWNCFTADGVTYAWGVIHNELVDEFKEGEGPTSWIASILVGVTLCAGILCFYLFNIFRNFSDLR